MTAEIQELQQSLRLSLNQEWLAAFATSIPATSSSDQKLDSLLAAFLAADLSQTGAGRLPADLKVTASARLAKHTFLHHKQELLRK